VSVNSARTARAIVNGALSYVDWFPHEKHTTRRAEAFFSSGKPFSRIERQHIQTFENAGVLRNVLVHQSTHSVRKFKKRFVEGKSLPTREHNPAAYLRGSHAVGQTRMAFLMATLVNALESLCV
jgi:hypothetical protein